MDFDLVSNALRLVFESSSVTFLGASIAEVDSSSVIVTFATTVAAYRMVLPHPEVIIKVVHTHTHTCMIIQVNLQTRAVQSHNYVLVERSNFLNGYYLSFNWCQRKYLI